MTRPPPALTHAFLDLAHRRRKAQKIVQLLASRRPLAGARILEVGCGSGAIAETLAQAAGPAGQVLAIDPRDERATRQGFGFARASGLALPFPDGSFDVLVSNHVIEHVGGRPAQLAHLREIRRVLAAGGIAYLAAPNRWALCEPHYRVWFLSWLPRPLRGPYLRALGRARAYDCEPPGPVALRRMIAAAGLDGEPVAAQALRLLLRIEGHPSLARLVSLVPDALLEALGPGFPTLVVLLARPLGRPADGPTPG